ncbi:MAG TPA: LuxR C-terminal-related transcriptional regulator [Gaiellaceae bacterium]|nr:LuxR C-terminal-related transcriptional regulator [Gaiellaceae bacterium]
MTDLAQELEELGGADITAALEDVSVHAFLLDKDAIVRWQNKAAREMIGDRVGKKWAAVMTERSIRDAQQVWRTLICEGAPAEVTVEAVLRDGTTEHRDISAAPLREGGAVVGVFGVGVPSKGPAHVSPGKFNLTERQVEVLQLLADGKSTDQIASALYISKTTVRNHIARLMAELQVHTRVQAIVVASRAGLISMR